MRLAHKQGNHKQSLSDPELEAILEADRLSFTANSQLTAN